MHVQQRVPHQVEGDPCCDVQPLAWVLHHLPSAHHPTASAALLHLIHEPGLPRDWLQYEGDLSSSLLAVHQHASRQAAAVLGLVTGDAGLVAVDAGLVAGDAGHERHHQLQMIADDAEHGQHQRRHEAAAQQLMHACE